MKVSYLQSPWQDNDLGGKRQGKSVCFVRYGGFGDMIQASSVFPYYKKHGWNVVVNTGKRGYNIIKNDPNVDEVLIQEHNQVEPKDLNDYWAKLSNCFTKFVQFSESVEGKLLAIPGRPEYKWDKDYRDKKMDKDYFHQMHELSDTPLPPQPRFYPSKKEEKWVKRFLKKIGKRYTIMWVLSGSSVHKSYPHMDSVIAGLMAYTKDIKIIFVGDSLCQLLEENWRNEKRIIRKSGRLSIRKTLALANHMDMVIGPETGVLNSVAFLDIPKIIMLSHSSSKNIGGSWRHTITMQPDNVSCYPCHKMHYGWKTCNRDEETGGAMCAAKINPAKMFEAIKQMRAA